MMQAAPATSQSRGALMPDPRIDRGAFSESRIDIGGMQRNIVEITTLRQSNDLVDFETDSYSTLLIYREIRQRQHLFSVPYQNAFVLPLLNMLYSYPVTTTLTPPRYYRNIFWDLTQCFIQRCDAAGQEEMQNSIYALQEVVSDLYEALLRCEKRRQVKPPDSQLLPAIVKFDRGKDEIYTFPMERIHSVAPDVKVAIVSFSRAFAQGGAAVWAALAHETVGHDFLHANEGLLAELKNNVLNSLMHHLPKGPHREFLANYWAIRTDETASDILGLLHLGPAAGVGLLAYFRALSGNQKLRSEGSLRDNYPADILRGLLAAEVVSRFESPRFKRWGETLLSETLKDLPSEHVITLGNFQIPYERALQSVKIVVDAIAWTQLASLEKRAIAQIRMWSEYDAQRSDYYEETLTRTELRPSSFDKAHHILSGAVLASMKGGAKSEHIFSQMIRMLSQMHKNNPLWFSKPPLGVRAGEAYAPPHAPRTMQEESHAPPAYRERGSSGEYCTIS